MYTVATIAFLATVDTLVEITIVACVATMDSKLMDLTVSPVATSPTVATVHTFTNWLWALYDAC